MKDLKKEIDNLSDKIKAKKIEYILGMNESNPRYVYGIIRDKVGEFEGSVENLLKKVDKYVLEGVFDQIRYVEEIENKKGD